VIFTITQESVLESVEVGAIVCVAFLFTKFKYELHNLIFI
jgi:hypothetical protein